MIKDIFDAHHCLPFISSLILTASLKPAHSIFLCSCTIFCCLLCSLYSLFTEYILVLFMTSLNNILPLCGAILPALYQARYAISSDTLSKIFIVKFTYNIIWSFFVVSFSCLTLHVNILDKEIILLPGKFNMTVLHYFVVVGFGLIFLANYIFGLLIDFFENNKSFSIIPFAFIILFVTLNTAHILFIEFLLTIQELG